MFFKYKLSKFSVELFNCPFIRLFLVLFKLCIFSSLSNGWVLGRISYNFKTTTRFSTSVFAFSIPHTHLCLDGFFFVVFRYCIVYRLIWMFYRYPFHHLPDRVSHCEKCLLRVVRYS